MTHTRDKEATGDCFVVAGQLISTSGEDHELCHAIVSGQGPLAGVRFAHAWVEHTQQFVINGHDLTSVTAIDESNGNYMHLPAELYYKLGNIEPRNVRRYSSREACARMLSTGDFGPWETLL